MATPITAEVRDEGWEAGQARAAGQDRGHTEQPVQHARLVFPYLAALTILI